MFTYLEGEGRREGKAGWVVERWWWLGGGRASWLRFTAGIEA